MSHGPVIRDSDADDETALGELDRRTWSPAHSVQERPRPPYPPFFDASHRPAHFLVAELPPEGATPGEVPGGPEEDGSEEKGGPVLVGYIRLVPPTPLTSNRHVRQIQGLVVDERARGRGIARALVEAACERARAQGATRVTLRVLGHNAPARALYRATGFRVEGVLPGEFVLEGRPVDDVLMGRTLAP